MTRRGFLGLVGSVPFFGLFAKRAEASPVQAKSSPPREAVGSAKVKYPSVWSNRPCNTEPLTAESLERMMVILQKQQDAGGRPYPKAFGGENLWGGWPAAPKGGAS